MKPLTFVLLLATAAALSAEQQQPAPAANLLQIKRVYVGTLMGGKEADELRELLIAGIDADKLFIITDDPDRADAVLKGAAKEETFTDTFDSSEGITSRENGGKYGGTGTKATKSGGYMGAGGGDNESHHIRERKHQAYAAVRLCNREGDVVWSTTQESNGAKFRGASADVAQKIARQLALDFDRARNAPEAK